MKIRIKRAYEAPDVTDGYRMLVDRLWPRGVKKEVLALDEWCKDVAPSADLRIWFAHDPARFDGFRARYIAELDDNTAVSELYKRAEGNATLTLIYAAKDPRINHAVILRDYLAKMLD